MASLVFPMGRQGLHRHKQTHIYNVLDPINNSWNTLLLKHKFLPDRKHTFLHSHSLSRDSECNHAIANCSSLSKHRQGKDHQRERERENATKGIQKYRISGKIKV